MARRIICILVIIIALCAVAYPFVAEHINSKLQEEIVLKEQETIANTDEAVLSSALTAAEAYNKALLEGKAASEDEYKTLLDLSGTGVMGYVEIPCINVKLAVYHGCGEEVLSKGVGHIYGTSLPVGGKGTHTFISGHTGMNNQKMFTDLEKLETGDLFYLSALGRRCVYRVSEIRVVDPYATDVIRAATADEDKATLITCTPYGVNSHRLIVTGTRVELTDEEQEQAIEKEKDTTVKASAWEQQYVKAIAVGFATFAVIVIIGVLIRRIKNSNKEERI